MKKIWPWLLLLLLLMLLCVWTKKDSIYLHSLSQTSTAKAVPIIAEDKHYIAYTIEQRNTGYILNGRFANTQQQNVLTQTTAKTGSTLSIKNTSTNATLSGEEAIALTQKILPHFIANYHNGKIVCKKQKITITGTADSLEAQREMQRLLNTSAIASLDNSNVAIVDKPIEYVITKENDIVTANGTVNDSAQIQSHLPNTAVNHLETKAHRIDNGSLPVVEKFLPFFLEKYTKGKISYHNEQLTIDGMVQSKDDLAAAQRLLSGSNTPIIDHTQVDPVLLAKAKAEAKQSQEEAKRKAELEAEAQRMKALEAQKQAQLKAEQKAQEEAAKQAQLKAARKTMEEAAQKAKLEAEAQRMKEIASAKEKALKSQINNLLKMENIEFNVNKSTLTQKGKNTVDKLADILKEYSSIHIEIAGHTDADGSAAYNQKLSQSRVNMVKNELVAQGIKADRLTAKGYGETKPLVPNTTPENKAKNRRVEINILGE